jgi:type II secretory pathway pseudopilin PulG
MNGYSLLELLFVLTLGLTLAGLAVPVVSADLDAARARAAIRFLSVRMAEARADAVARGATVALRFVETAEGVTMSGYVDGNGNGVLTADIADGTDAPVAAAVLLSDLFPRVFVAFDPGRTPSSPAVPGQAHLFSFSPSSTATSGTVYLRAGTGPRYGVRVFGVTARTRTIRYLPAADSWIDLE